MTRLVDRPVAVRPHAQFEGRGAVGTATGSPIAGASGGETAQGESAPGGGSSGPGEAKTGTIAFLVQGLFEISDSIGYDCVYQFKQVAGWAGRPANVRIFAERFVAERHPGIPIEPLEAFLDLCTRDRDVVVVYHYCGAWLTIDRFLQERAVPFVVRWHNNTPPWFYMDENQNNVLHTLDGFENIVALARSPLAHFWVNSEFTRQQLLALGGAADRCSTVYPASRYLESETVVTRSDHQHFGTDGFNLLFVGRVVAHKGHCAMIATAARLREISGREVIVHIAGRESSAKRRIQYFADEHKVEVRFYGEISEEALADLYAIADVFVCLSEHEGFGLPVFEAMRSGVPVVAWACTAFAELLRAHPLSFENFDLNTFAAAIATLQDETIRTRVLEAQQSVLAQYTPAVIRDQMLEALAAMRSEHRRQALLAALPPALAEDGVASARVLDALDLVRASGTPVAPAAHDSGANLMSLYDIMIFRRFFAALKKERFVPFEARQKGAGLHLEAAQFEFRYGFLDGAVLRLPAGHYPTDHLIYGPFIEFPPGEYQAVVQLKVTSVTGGGRFEIDTNIQPHGVIAKLVIAAEDLRAGSTPPLRFSIPPGLVPTEFRIRPLDPFDGAIEFRGVNVWRVPAGH